DGETPRDDFRGAVRMFPQDVDLRGHGPAIAFHEHRSAPELPGLQRKFPVNGLPFPRAADRVMDFKYVWCCKNSDDRREESQREGLQKFSAVFHCRPVMLTSHQECFEPKVAVSNRSNTNARLNYSPVLHNLCRA